MSGTSTPGELFTTQLSRIHVIGVDPGKMTGLARIHGPTSELTTGSVPAAEVSDILEVWLNSPLDAIIGCERFVITRNTARKTPQHDALEVTGVVRDVVRRSNARGGQLRTTASHRVVDQNMSDAKKFGSPRLIKALGWWRTGALARHQNDAIAQVLKVLADHHPAWVHRYVTPDII